MFLPTFFLFLILYVFSRHFIIEPNGINTIIFGPKYSQRKAASFFSPEAGLNSAQSSSPLAPYSQSDNDSPTPTRLTY